MRRYAHLFGAATGGLGGVAADLARMTALLQKHGFDAIESHPAATRSDILGAFEQLAWQVRPGDGVVVYYSGHGVRLRDPDTREHAYAIVPVGADTAPPDEFGYVLREELSAWFWQLTAITHNITWIADCCHAGGVFRGVRKVRGREERPQRFLHLRRELLAQLPREALAPDGNPHVVRVCAAANELRAFEDPDEGGLMTQALARTLDEIGHRPIVCEDLARLVVCRLARERQTPVFAGPVRRLWLTAETVPPRPFPTAVLHSQGTLILGGTLLDQRPGDRYGVLGSDGGIAVSLRVTRPLAHRSHTEREPNGSSAPLATGASAVLQSAGEPRGAVAVPDATPPEHPLIAGLTASGYLALAGTTDAPLVARIIADGDQLYIVTANEEKVGAWPADGDLRPLFATVEGLARQQALLALPATNADLLATKYRITPPTESTPLQITSVSRLLFYVSAFALFADGRIELVTTGRPDGESVAPDRTLTVRPPRAFPPGTRLAVVVTDTRIDLRGWTATTPTAPEPTRGDATPWFGLHAFTLPPESESA